MSVFNSLRSSKHVSWKPTGRLQQTLASCVERRGKALHSGEVSTVRLCPGRAGEGRYFDFCSTLIPASVDFAEVSPLCTTLCKDGFRIRTVEHLLSALEAAGVDNCRIEIENSNPQGHDAEIPIFDGSAREWVAAVEEVGLKVATNPNGKKIEKMAAHVNEPVYVWRNDSFVAAFPSKVVQISYGINFPQRRAVIPASSCQIPDLLAKFHDSGTGGHSGFLRTYKRLAAVVYWRGMRRRVKEYVAGCHICQQNK